MMLLPAASASPQILPDRGPVTDAAASQRVRFPLPMLNMPAGIEQNAVMDTEVKMATESLDAASEIDDALGRTLHEIRI